MKYTLKNKEIELTDEEVSEIVKQNSKPVEEKKIGLEIKNRITGDIIFTSTKTTWREAVEEGKANLRGANLREANLREANLREANLYGADLREADLCEADLCEANLYGADLRGADLRGADLREADLCEADLSGADLSGADLSGAEMQNVKFWGKGGTTKIKQSQVDDFFKALGVVVEL